MAALLLTHAVVFVGYSLSDPNFRLLIESQLAVFGAQAPPRYAVMEAVGAQEAQILRRTAGIEAIAYPPGEHDSVAAFLGTIASAARPEGAPRRRAAVEVLRERTPQPALCLSLRPRDAMLDVEWFETTTDDLAGARVPLERRSQASLTSLPWAELAKVTGELSGPAMREVGELLARPFARLPIPFRPGGRPRLVVVDVPQELAAVPWGWMSVEGEPLCLAVPVCRTVPGFDDAARGRPFFHDPLRVLLVGDALAESPRYHHPLPGTRAEVRAIRALFAAASRRHHVTLLKGSEASYARVLREMTGGYDIVHLAGVAFVDGSGESVVPLHDGEVRASELAALLIQNPPGLLFVNEDYSGFVPTLGHALLEGVGFAYGDLYHKMRQLRPGLERVVARAGVGTFIGCMAPCREDVARAIALDFYTELLAGRSVADALFRARTARDRSEEDTALVFAAAGYPDARITSRVPGASPARRPPPRPRRRRSR
jgi:hypothetical protein